MSKIQSVHEWMSERRVELEQLEETSGLDRKLLTAIIEGRYTPSPEQRERVAGALGIAKEEIAWGHTNEVTHLYGHGPQFGRTP
jgi:transcriptional regulator with XRE-family HTH domain